MNKIDKNELFNKLSKAKPEDIKRIGLDNNEIEYIKNKILTTKLGLQLNWEEKDENLDQNYFGLEEINELNINIKEQERERERERERENHLLIEGDNYYALKALQISGIKVDVIYIDPPYNTGNKDFIYEDNYVDKDDKYKHSKWLTFMKNRLTLAKELLADDGVIFVSINDNEHAYLKVLMDEIFGEENFISNLFWQTNNSSMKSIKFIRNDFENILSFAKQKPIINYFRKKINKNISFSNPDNDINGDWFSSNATYKYDEENQKTFDIKLPNGNLIRRTWRFTKQQYENGEIPLYFLNDNVPRLKIYKKDYDIEKPFSNILLSMQINLNSSIENLEELEEFKNILQNFNFIDSFSKSKNEIKKIGIEFDTPKPTNLIKFLINLYNKKNNPIILDFFAGSGTTGQAVMELNEEDGGNRRFILCTNNENNIARDVCRERLYRVINGVGSKNEPIDWKYSSDKPSLKNNSVKYLKVKQIHKIDGEFEDINTMKKLYKQEFKKDLSIKDFR